MALAAEFEDDVTIEPVLDEDIGEDILLDASEEIFELYSKSKDNEACILDSMIL